MNIIRGYRTDCINGVTEEVELEYNIVRNDSEFLKGWSFHLIGGPTGYESFCITDELPRNKMKDMLDSMGLNSMQKDLCNPDIDGNWVACAGTEGKWDKLEVPMSELRRVIPKELYSI